MFRAIVADLESALKDVKVSELLSAARRNRGRPAEEFAAFSAWLPYRAYLEDQDVFVNRDALGFCLEVRPQSGADEEMSRILTAWGRGWSFSCRPGRAASRQASHFDEPAVGRSSADFDLTTR